MARHDVRRFWKRLIETLRPDRRDADAAREIAALNGDPNFMTSLARGLAVIKAFTEQRRKLTIAQISDRTGIPRAAVRRCLYTLEKLGYVASEAHAFALRSLGSGADDPQIAIRIASSVSGAALMVAACFCAPRSKIAC